MNKRNKIATVIIVIVIIIITLAIYFEYYVEKEVKTITAKEGIEYAQTIAKDWSSDSKLITITSHEGKKKDISPDLKDIANDPKIGDGKTVYWSYSFSSDLKNKRFSILLDAEMNVMKTLEQNGSISALNENYSYDYNISNWKIDSDIAIKNALIGDYNFIKYYNIHKTIVISYFLMDWTFLTIYYSQPVLWQIIYGSEDEYIDSVFVDAIDGSVWKDEDLFWP